VMSSKPTIVVLGATGAQGGAVVDALVALNKYHIRGVTRNTASDKAKELEKKGVEVVKADLKNKEEILAAFKGAEGVFAVTNFWDPDIYPNNIALEVKQGKIIADAAKDVGVKKFIWSSLHDVHKITGGILELPHFTGKHKVQEYIQSIGLPAAFVYAGFYWSNLGSFFPPQFDPDGTPRFTLPFKPHTKVPGLDIYDFGPIVREMFEKFDEFKGKNVLAASEYLTMPEMLDIYTKVTGQKVHYDPADSENAVENVEIRDTIKWFNQWGYYNKEDISEARKIYPVMKTFEQWMRATNFHFPAKS